MGGRPAGCGPGRRPIAVTGRWSAAERARLRRAGADGGLDNGRGQTCRAMNEPFPLAYALLRLAEALSEDGAREEAGTVAAEAHPSLC